MKIILQKINYIKIDFLAVLKKRLYTTYIHMYRRGSTTVNDLNNKNKKIIFINSHVPRSEDRNHGEVFCLISCIHLNLDLITREECVRIYLFLFFSPQPAFPSSPLLFVLCD